MYMYRRPLKHIVGYEEMGLNDSHNALQRGYIQKPNSVNCTLIQKLSQYLSSSYYINCTCICICTICVELRIFTKYRSIYMYMYMYKRLSMCNAYQYLFNCRWALWYYKSDKNKEWKDNIKLVISFDTVGQQVALCSVFITELCTQEANHKCNYGVLLH